MEQHELCLQNEETGELLQLV